MRRSLTNPVLDHEARAFREEVRAFAESFAPDRDPLAYFHDRSHSADVYRELGARGWLSLGWPVEHGGEARGPVFEYLLWDELAYARLARFDIAAGLVAKSLIAEGTPDQKAALLPGIRAGEIRFALGYSEPEAGSDLGSLRTRAVLDGDVYRVSGEKRWTSDAHHAHYLWLLARTGTQEAKTRGLSLFVCDLSLPGVEIRPIITISGHRLNEVFLDEVPVPASQRVGEENRAWRIMQTALGYERHLQFFPGRLWRDLDDLECLLADAGRLDDPAAQRVLAELTSQVAAIEAHSLGVVHLAGRGHNPVLEAARNKVIGGRLTQRIARAPFELGITASGLADSPFGFLWRQSISETIAGGTHEIMVRIVAQRELDLKAGG